VWAVGDDVPRLLTAKTLNRAASLTARKSMHGATVSDWPIFWHMGAQILARRDYRGDVLCSRPCQGLAPPQRVLQPRMVVGCWLQYLPTISKRCAFYRAGSLRGLSLVDAFLLVGAEARRWTTY